MEKDCQWFLVPTNVDPHTNECIARELARINEADGNDIIFKDNVGVMRSGWRVSYAILISFLKAAERDNRLKITPFVKEGGGQYRKYKLLAVKKKSEKVKDAKRQLEEIQKRKSLQKAE